MPAACKFTQYADQLAEILEEGRDEDLISCDSKCIGRSGLSGSPNSPIEAISKFLVLTDACKPTLPNVLTETNAEESSYTDNMNGSKEKGNFGLAIAMTVQALPPPFRVGLASPRLGRSSSLNSGSLTCAEALSNPSLPPPRLPMRRRILTPGKRMANALKELSISQSSAAQPTSAPASEADTEASETFGQKLQRYRHVDDEDKENEDRWWTDSISYG
jgi:hypothetical protein